jgi:hypothetical protein
LLYEKLKVLAVIRPGPSLRKTNGDLEDKDADKENINVEGQTDLESRKRKSSMSEEGLPDTSICKKKKVSVHIKNRHSQVNHLKRREHAFVSK